MHPYFFSQFKQYLAAIFCHFIGVATLLTLLFSFSQNSFAQITQDQEQRALQQNIQNQQRIEQERQEIIKQREIDSIKNIKPIDDSGLKTKEETKIFDNGGCFVPGQVTIKGNSIFPTATLSKKFINQYQAKCLTKTDISAIQKDLANFYIKKGYSNARVYFDKEQLIKNKILIFVIVEGIVESINLEENSKIDKFKYLAWRNSTKLFTAFPLKTNKPFNLRDFEQGIEQMNRLQSGGAKIDSKAGKQDGTSDITIKNEIGKTTNLSIGYDNMGQESTGKQRRKASISQDNLLALNDNIFINYTKDNGANDTKRMSESLYSAISIPLGYWTFGTSYSESKYLTTLVDNNISFTSSGRTTQHNYSIERMLVRGQSYKLSFKSDLALKDTASFVRDIKSPTGSRKLTVLENSLIYKLNNFDKTLGKSSSTYANLTYAKGLDWLNAKKDIAGLANSNAHAQFDKLSLSLSHSQPLSQIFTYKLALDSSYSFDTLFGSERFNIGGPYSVRGFNENSLSADRGYFIKNDLEMHLPSQNTYINRATFSVFYDYGSIRSKYVINESDKGYMSGAGAKVQYPHQNFDVDLTYSRGLHAPKSIQNISHQTPDKESIYLNLNLKFGI